MDGEGKEEVDGESILSLGLLRLVGKVEDSLINKSC